MILFLIMTDFPLVHVKMDIMVIHMIAAQISTNANFIKFPKNYIGKLFSALKCCILMCEKCLSPTRKVLQILLHVDCINIYTQPFMICQYVKIKFHISTGNSSNAHVGNIWNSVLVTSIDLGRPELNSGFDITFFNSWLDVISRSNDVISLKRPETRVHWHWWRSVTCLRM